METPTPNATNKTNNQSEVEVCGQTPTPEVDGNGINETPRKGRESIYNLTPNSSNKIDANKELEIKLEMIKETFLELFISKGYSRDVHFYDKVFFLMKSDGVTGSIPWKSLRSKQELNNYIKDNQVLKLIFELDEKSRLIDQRNNQNSSTIIPVDFDKADKIKVNVGEFIDRISEKIVHLHLDKHHAKMQIEYYNAVDIKNRIEKRLMKIKENNKIHFKNDSDGRQASYQVVSEDYQLKSKSQLKVYLNIAENLKPNNEYNIEFELEKIVEDIDDRFKRKISDIRSTVINDYIVKENLFLNFSVENTYENFHHKKTDNIQLESIKKGRQNVFVKGYEKVVNFASNFKFIENWKEIGIDKSYSGCGLSSFVIKIKNSNGEEIAQSEKIYFIDLIIVSVENLLKSECVDLTTNYPIKINSTINQEEYYLELDFYFNFGELTLNNILRRVFHLFSSLINYEKECDNALSPVLEYFKNTIKPKITYILESKVEQRNSKCCGIDCQIF